MHKIPLRKEVPDSEKWDLSLLYKTESDFFSTLTATENRAKKFIDVNKQNFSDYRKILQCLPEYETILEELYKLSTYVSLNLVTDYTDENAQKLYDDVSIRLNNIFLLLADFSTAMNNLSLEDLQKCCEIDADHEYFWQLQLKNKPHTLSNEAEKVLVALEPILWFPYNLYSSVKQTDLKFSPWEYQNKTLPLDFVTFENTYQYEPDTEIRRQAFAKFSESLRSVGNTFAGAYNAHVQREKIVANLRNYDSVFTYLLSGQDVTRDLYDRQIDIIMNELAPIMRRYVKLLKKVHGWDKITYADLQVPLDPGFSQAVTREEANEYVLETLGIMGEEYVEVVKKALYERWIDFAHNQGKETGGFCSTPFKSNSFILLSWNQQLGDVFTLIHELGHALHFHYVNENQPFLHADPSSYLIEAPSTCNEMLLSRHLVKKNDDPRFKRWVLASMIGNTYYHNFVTHLLEATFQRKVYKLVDGGESVNFSILCSLMKETLQEFWGDEVELVDGAELTWMRQPHYYMGLYSYTYSAGLTLATVISKRISEQGKEAVADWQRMLRAGGSMGPIELAKLAKVDLTTPAPLQETIKFIGETVDELEKLTAELEA